MKLDYIKEYPVLNNNIYYRIDFAIQKENKIICFIEYDGEQHFRYNNRGWNTKENYERTIKGDKIKEKYAADNQIPMIRIKYTDFDKLNINYLKEKIIDFL